MVRVHAVFTQAAKKKRIISPQQRAAARAEREAASRLMYLGWLFIQMTNIQAYRRTLIKRMDHGHAVQMLDKGQTRYASFTKILGNLSKQAARQFADFAPIPATPPAARPSRQTR